MKITLLFLLFSALVSAQGKPEDLAKKIFGHFKNNQLDSIYAATPKFEEITSLAIASGLDKNSKQYQEFVTQYPEIIKDFKLKCQELYSSDRRLKFEWKNAEIENVVTEEFDVPVRDDNNKPTDNSITFVKARVYFTADNKHFIMRFRDLKTHNKEWKIGFAIDLDLNITPNDIGMQ